MTGLVERLVGHAGGDSAISNDSYDVIFFAGHIAGHRHAQRRGDRCAGVSGAKNVVGAFIAGGEAGDATVLAQRAEFFTPPGKQLVDIALMTDVPDNFIDGAIKNAVKGNRKLNYTEVGSEMTAGVGNRGNNFLTELSGERFQLCGG